MERALATVRRRIQDACERAGRDPLDVTLIGVTKGQPAEAAAAGAAAGIADLGENYVEELERKRGSAPDVRWHFLGRLQSNKARRIVEAADLIHSLEPGRAAGRLLAMGERLGKPVPVLVEVDFAGDRVGVPPEQTEAFVERMAGEGWVEVRGLMTIAPLRADPRPVFAHLRALRDGLRERHAEVRELSMGMSADLDAAIEEGATMVRVGSAIFGPRPIGGA